MSELKWMGYGVIAIVLLAAIVGITERISNSSTTNTDNTKTENTNENTNKENTNLSTTTNSSTSSREVNQVPNKEEVNKKMIQAKINTNKGVIEIMLDPNAAPKTVENFVKLAESKFYDGVKFHRVIKDFMIQTGDPFSKDISKIEDWGKGGPGYRFDDELTGNEKYTLGTIAMANAGPNTNGSQFFIVTANPGVGLPPAYTVFGKVTKGIEVAEAIQDVKTNANDRPLEDVVISSIVVVK